MFNSTIIFSDDITTYIPNWMLIQCMINSLPMKIDNETLITLIKCDGKCIMHINMLRCSDKYIMYINSTNRNW